MNELSEIIKALDQLTIYMSIVVVGMVLILLLLMARLGLEIALEK